MRRASKEGHSAAKSLSVLSPDSSAFGPRGPVAAYATSLLPESISAYWNPPAMPLSSSRHSAGSRTAVHNLYGLLDSLDEPVFLLDARGRILLSNQAGASLTDAGFPASDGNGWLWDCVLQLLHRALEGEGPLDRTVFAPDASLYWRVSLRELHNSPRDARRFALCLRDVTQHERLQQSVRASESLTRSGVLLASAAHQTKNLLFILSASLEALQAVHASELTGDVHVENLKDGIARMQGMLQSVFAQARPRGACLRFQTASLVREAIRGCIPLALSRDVNICQGSFADVAVLCEPEPLIRALENLIDNAVRHSPEGSVVTADVDFAAGDTSRLSIRIADHGPGFSREDASQLFTPFFTRRPGGTGLGLAVARSIVQQHGGQITLANSELGGAVVTILLPVAPAVPACEVG